MNLSFFRMLTRANQDQPEPTPPTPSVPHMFDTESFEHDPSPLATLTIKFFEELTTPKKDYWESFCELNSSAPECKIYED